MSKDDPVALPIDINKTLQQAVEHHRASRLQDAERGYLAILKAQASHPDANYNLGVLAVQVNQPAVALPYFKTALDVNPKQGQYWLSYIDALIKVGQLENARQVLQQAQRLGLRGPSVEDLGQRLSRLFSPSSAAQNFPLGTQNTEFFSLSGMKSKKKKSSGRGKEKLRKGKISCQPGNSLQKEINDLVSAFNQGRIAEAETRARTMTQAYPHIAMGWNVFGVVLGTLGRTEDALLSMQKAAVLVPSDADVHSNLGTILKDLGRLLEAEASYRQALSLKPDYAEVHTNLGNVLRYLGRLTEAEASYRQALSLKPNYADAHNNLGNLHKELGRLTEAEASYRQALALKPDYAEAYSNLLFSLNVNSNHSASEGLAEARRYSAMLSTSAQPYADWTALNRKARPLRVGLVSGDLRRHPVGYFLEKVLVNLCGNQIELLAYVTQPVEDDLTRRLKLCCTSWRSLVGLRDVEAARRIHDDGIHVLIDLAGHTAHNRLPVFFWKPAPVQVSWLGYFATTGVEQMDYLLADRVGVPPDQQPNFSEQVWYLPETRLCFAPPDIDVPIAPLPALSRGHITFGCFQDLGKLNDATLKIWGRILNALPNAVLRLQNMRLGDEAVCNTLRHRLEAQGINARQVVLWGGMTRAAYLAAYAEVDLLLDTFPYPGGTTTCEGLWMGVPTLTLAGKTLLERQGASLLTAAGLSEWVATNQEEYVVKAVAFGRDFLKLAQLREGLREQVGQSSLFDAARFAGRLGAALLNMWGRWCEQHSSAR